MKSLLLRQLADAAGGASAFGFIPDGTMNATVHNCAVANLDVTCCADSRLVARLLPGGSGGAAADAPVRVLGGYGAKGSRLADGTWEVVCCPGAVQYGQPRGFVLEYPPGELEAGRLQARGLPSPPRTSRLTCRCPRRPALSTRAHEHNARCRLSLARRSAS